VLSAHRSPDALTNGWNSSLQRRSCFIAGAGVRRIWPCDRSKNDTPVLGVPIPPSICKDWIHCCRSYRCPRGSRWRLLPSRGGRCHAGLFAVAMLAQGDAKLAQLLAQFRASQPNGEERQAAGLTRASSAFPCLRSRRAPIRSDSDAVAILRRGGLVAFPPKRSTDWAPTRPIPQR